MRAVLAVGAHPDDIELGCAGTLALHKLRGDKVYLLVLTRGEASGEPEVRERECRRAAKILGANDVFIGGLPDTRVNDGRETIDVIEKVTDEIRPDIMYAPTYKDTHQDHRNAGQASLSAGRYCRMILLYEGASTGRDFCPEVFVNIEKTFKLKMKVLGVYGSQLNGKSGSYASAARAVEGLAKFRGRQAARALDVAEAFEVGRFIFEV